MSRSKEECRGAKGSVERRRRAEGEWDTGKESKRARVVHVEGYESGAKNDGLQRLKS